MQYPHSLYLYLNKRYVQLQQKLFQLAEPIHTVQRIPPPLKLGFTLFMLKYLLYISQTIF